MRLGRWELVRPLGRGGMGEVWLARDPASGEEVALKRLLFARVPGALARFQRESTALLRLRHPAVVAWRDAGVDAREGPWLAMELVRGGTLADRVDTGGPLPPREAVQLVLDLCHGLAAVHASGALHRDLKPTNVLLDGAGRPKLTDFGLARPTERGESLTATGTFLGSPGFMAPEQVRGAKDAIGPATDVYGLGATLHYALTGQAPFEAETPVACLARILQHAPQPPSTGRPGLPAELDAIVLRCLAKSPADRYPHAMALHAALNGWLLMSARRARPRLRPPVVLGAVVIAAAALAGAVLALLPGRAPDRHEEALGEVNALIERDPGDARAWLVGGVLKLQLQRWDEAIEDFDQAIGRHDGPLLEAHYFRGQARAALGEHALALEDYDVVQRSSSAPQQFPDLGALRARSESALRGR